MIWFETDTNTFWGRNSANDAWTKFYTTDKKPTKVEIGLGNVPNYSATGSLTDGSANKLATAAATKALQDNKLDKTATAPNSAKLNNQSASFYATADHAHTPSDIGAAPANHNHSASQLPKASPTAQGVVQLSNSTTGKSESKAATELAVSQAKAEAIASSVFPGFIGMFAGTEEQIEPGWQLCNGQGETSNGIPIPNLKDRFVIGAGGGYDVGATGGSVSATTAVAGNHSHTVSVGNTTLSSTQIPAHGHAVKGYRLNSTGNYYIKGVVNDGFNQSRPDNNYSGVSNVSTYNAGNSGSHNHSGICADGGNHSHTVSTMSPYYALCYIIKL
ncbi:tail fiber protein [uncultured Endozoicomonas sp.]|uniref:tail fiber protein n=1 Tax=uncultured Endozoicomonas sp. TaxID=432652 RepID=UPI00261178A5|nr:tail fiber protein [uncultured Endozoicomonas sp.]